MAKQTFVYVHIYDKPRYVGEGTEDRAMKSLRYGRGTYAAYSQKHRNEHVCKVIVGKYDNKVSAWIMGQGMMAWFGMRLKKQGPLMNSVSFTSVGGMAGTYPEEVEKRRTVSKETKRKISECLTGRRAQDETRKKISEKAKQLYADGRQNPTKKGVVVVLLDGKEMTFRSQIEAGKFFGITPQGVARITRTGKTRLKIKSIRLE